MIPLMIDFSGKRVVIFGGGEVGARKARYFCRETEVTVISRSFHPAFNELPVKRLETKFDDATDPVLHEMVRGAFLVIAATPDESLNARIGRICALETILFNDAGGRAGDVDLPSQIRGDHYTIAISTGGDSPGISRFLRVHLERTFPQLDRMIELQKTMREILKSRIPDQDTRGEILRRILEDGDIWNALRSGQDEALALAMKRYCG